MRIVVVGASGTIGKAVATHLGARHEIVRVTRKSGDIKVDITSFASIQAMFDRVGPFDALASCAGNVAFAPFSELDEIKYGASLEDKLMGQINLVRLGLAKIREGGSFTLVSGVLSHDPIVGGAAASLVNGALESWVRAAAIEIPKCARVNVVSPTVLTESMDTFGPYFKGFEPVPAARVALAYEKCIEGKLTGQVLRVE